MKPIGGLFPCFRKVCLEIWQSLAWSLAVMALCAGQWGRLPAWCHDLSPCPPLTAPHVVHMRRLKLHGKNGSHTCSLNWQCTDMYNCEHIRSHMPHTHSFPWDTHTHTQRHRQAFWVLVPTDSHIFIHRHCVFCQISSIKESMLDKLIYESGSWVLPSHLNILKWKSPLNYQRECGRKSNNPVLSDHSMSHIKRYIL